MTTVNQNLFIAGAVEVGLVNLGKKQQEAYSSRTDTSVGKIETLEEQITAVQREIYDCTPAEKPELEERYRTLLP